MKIFTAPVIALASVFVLVSGNFPSVAQQQAPVQVRKIERGGPGVHREIAGDILSVPELSALFAEEKGKIVVDHIMEPEMRAKGYEKTDLEEGDMVLMANGRSLGSIGALKALYDSAATGATVKLGVKRKEEMLIASFVKADPDKLPKLKMIVSHGGDEDMFGIPQAGLIFGDKGKTVVVREVLSNPSSEVRGEARKGDIVVKLNGSPVNSLKALRAAYEKLAVGANIRLVTSRSGKESTLEFSKPKDEGRMIIRRQGNN